jgi:hypothetical protein
VEHGNHDVFLKHQVAQKIISFLHWYQVSIGIKKTGRT